MNRSFIVAVLTVTMIILMSATSYAANSHGFFCDNCHGRFLGGTGFVPAAKSCISCHNPMGEASRMPVDSMANYFGSVPGQSATGSRSSHTFMVSYSGAPSGVINFKSSKSNTLEAQTAALVANTPHNNQNQTKQVTCNRCHNALGSTTAFLRATNDNDALCLDCHRPRNTSTQATGSHPVAYRAYSTVYKSNTTAFRRIPLSANPNNPTAQLGNYMTVPNKGKIVCSTCHAPHYADSNSATLDNRSTANGFAQDDIAKGLKGQLQNSKGTLLRTDPIGVSATAINACSSCHKETANLNHNAKGQNIQCGHCHAAHVDYKAGDATFNRQLVRRDFSNMSTTKIKLGSNVKATFDTYTFMRVDNKGICQVCHTPTPGVAIHDLPTASAEDCIVCHKHSNGFSAADCTSCHGQPPMTSLVGGPNGKASNAYTIDESFTPHATHADPAYYHYACKNCHYDGTRQDSHNTATLSFQSVFVDPTNTSIGVLAGKPKNVPADYNASGKVCSNVYCHSNGSPRGGTYTTFATPPWEYGKNKILGTASECTACHQSGSTLTTNAHAKHVTTNVMKCNVCHVATVGASLSISDRTKHANGTKDVKFITRPDNFFGVFSSSWNSTDATCNNSCHSNGLGGAPAEQPVWTNSATGDCGSCHAAVATTSLHPFHFTGSTGPQLGASPDCASCHIYATGAITHANGDVDLKAGNSCAPCHPGTSPIWATGATVTCESCHTGATASEVTNQSGTYIAPLKELNSTVGHGQYAMAAQCINCHSSSAPHIGAGPTEKRLAPLSGNALCNNCHKSSVMGNMSTTRANLLVHGGSNPFNHYTTTADGRASECSGCHDTHGSSNRLSVRTVINGRAVSYTGSTPDFIVLNAPYNGLCQVCHTKTKYFNNNAAPVTSHATGDCLKCHVHKGNGATFAFEPVVGGCGGCHGYPPVKVMTGFGTLGNYSHAKLEDYSGGGGAHSVAGHISKTALQGNSWTNCNNCHNNLSHATGGTTVTKVNVNVVVDPKFKFNNATSIVYNANSCSNVSCHFKPSPNWVTGQ